MANKKNQHFVPKIHLKQYAVDRKRKQICVWLVKRDKLIPHASIRGQCSKDYFYGKDLVVEEFLGSPEGNFGSVLEKLKTGDLPNQKDFEFLLFYWLLQHLRSEVAIKDQIQAMLEMQRKIMLGHEEDEDLRTYFGPAPSSNEMMLLLFKNANDLFERISDLQCVLQVNPTKIGLVMSDNPAVSSNKFILKRYKEHKNWGFSNAGFYIYLPLTPELGFFAYDKKVYHLSGRNGRMCTLKERDVLALNQLVYLNCDNLVVLPDLGQADQMVEKLNDVSELRLESRFRTNVANLDKKGVDREYYVAVSDEEFAASNEDGLIHLERNMVKVKQHFAQLMIRSKPKFIDTRSSAGLLRYGAKSR